MKLDFFFFFFFKTMIMIYIFFGKEPETTIFFLAFTLSPQFLIWTLPSLNMETFIVAKRDSVKKSVIEWQTV